MAATLNQRPAIVTVTTQQTIEVTPRWLAEIFCGMDDEQQAQFFIDCAAIAATWKKPYGGAGYQWWLVGKHLRTCECSNDDAREMVREIGHGIDPPSQPYTEQKA